MIYSKQPHPENFEYVFSGSATTGKWTLGNTEITARVRAFEGDVFHIQITSDGLWTEEKNLVDLTPPPAGDTGLLEVGENFQLTIRNKSGRVLLESQPEMGFGVMGPMSIFCFRYHKSCQYFGMGEKCWDKFELSQRRARFWNTDALGDFPFCQWRDNGVDPYYVSVPYVVVRSGDDYVGLLLHNANSPFIDTGSDASFFGDQDHNRRLVLGAEDGVPSLWIIVGPTLAELTCKMAKLCGTAPLPPLWALGYVQCRWGYKGEKDLLDLDKKMVEHEIPNDGLWIDIDYMDGYRVFTYAEEHFPKGPAATLKKLERNHRRVCPIIDPGVKKDPGYAVYDSGQKAGIFCKNPTGKDYVGFVWPGVTVYPDFTTEKGRDWWAGYAADFLKQGFAGAWLDMNDPSTGAVDPYAMLFRDGTEKHIAFRNQYALGMQMATYQGFQRAAPNQRVFLLSRSGYVGSSRYSAIWTGDNVSTRYYLRAHIPQMLNMGLSGLPYAGNDIGGFAEDTNEALLVDWTKGYFLLPFFRIHSQHFHRAQEPWAFSKKALETIRHYIRLRYKLLPYLYQLFVEYHRDGHPMWRPMLYHYPSNKALGDQFLVGRDILQAPMLDEGASERKLELPGKQSWFDLTSGEWVKSGRVTAQASAKGTPIYLRDGAIIPCQPGLPTSNEKCLNEVELHFFLNEGSAGSLDYVFDDGETLDYTRGNQSEVRIAARLRKGVLTVTTETLANGFGPLKATGVFYGKVRRVVVNGTDVPVSKSKQLWTGKALSAVEFELS